MTEEENIKFDLEEIIIYTEICIKELPNCSPRRERKIKEALKAIRLATLYTLT